MVRSAASLVWLAVLAAAATARPAQSASFADLAALANSWGTHFVLTGTKTEPTYIEHIRLERNGDAFLLEGGAPAGMAPSRESMKVSADGSLRFVECPAAMRCNSDEPPSGFLASATIIAAVRKGKLTARYPVYSYGEFLIVCIPAERLGIRNPVLDPCAEIRSGAVMAQRHRLSSEFDGPSLDAWSIELSIPRSRSVSSRNQ
jgi:hypothetical protein